MESASPTEVAEVAARVLAEDLGASATRLLLVDYRLCVLQALSPGGERPSIPVDKGAPGRAFTSQQPAVVVEGGGARVWVPVTVRGERLGVLETRLPLPPDARTLQSLAGLATALAHALQVASRQTDLYEQAARTQRLTLAAEVQWQLLPGRGCTGPGLCLAGQLEPAYQVAGDNFDWSVAPDHVMVSLSDGMGRGVEAAQVTALAVHALRNARRAGLPLADQARMADEAIYGVHGGDLFVETLLLGVDLPRGPARAICTGSPCLLRQREDVVEPIALEGQIPLGLFEGTRYREQEVDLALGDRIVLISDGVHRARPGGREEFGSSGLERAILAVTDMPPPEAVRHIIQELLGYHLHSELRDDAVVVVFDWDDPGVSSGGGAAPFPRSAGSPPGPGLSGR